MTLSTDFIEPDRTFHISAANGAKSDDVDLTQLLGGHGLMNWKGLLAQPLVVILSGGGLPDGSRVSCVAELTEALQAHWTSVARNFPHVHAVQVIGIDLTLRAKPMRRSVAKNVGKKSTKKMTNSAAGGSARKAIKSPLPRFQRRRLA
jgi:hypothetical protein